jgi:hypothetical protein
MLVHTPPVEHTTRRGGAGRPPSPRARPLFVGWHRKTQNSSTHHVRFFPEIFLHLVQENARKFPVGLKRLFLYFVLFQPRGHGS